MAEDIHIDMDHNSRMSLNQYFDNRASKQSYIQNLNVPSGHGTKQSDYQTLTRVLGNSALNGVHPKISDVVKKAEDRYYMDEEQRKLAYEFTQSREYKQWMQNRINQQDSHQAVNNSSLNSHGMG